MNLGTRVRQIRELKGMTLRQLGEKSGLSTSLLSQVENSVTEPSINSLRAIARALNTQITEFFEDGSPKGMVVRAEERCKLRIPTSGLTYELLTPSSSKIEFLTIRLEPGMVDRAQAMGHEGDEAALVLEGQLDVWVGDDHFVLGPGDSIAFNSSLPHRIANNSDSVVLLVTAITPPNF